jgi:hypothetical protein
MTIPPENLLPSGSDARRPRVNPRVVALVLGLIVFICASVMATEWLSPPDRRAGAAMTAPATSRAGIAGTAP